MKNGNIDDKLKMQEYKINENRSASENKKEYTTNNAQTNSISTNQDNNKTDCSLLSIFSPISNFDATAEDELQIKKQKKKKKGGLRR